MDGKIALVLFAGPEMPCKLQHAFLFARDVAGRGGQACIVFEGNSPRWLPELADAEHALFRLFNTVKDEGLIAGVCRGCAQVHGVVETAEAMGLPPFLVFGSMPASSILRSRRCRVMMPSKTARAPP